MIGGKGERLTTFFKLAPERFEARVGTKAKHKELTWTFDEIQVRCGLSRQKPHVYSKGDKGCVIAADPGQSVLCAILNHHDCFSRAILHNI